VTAYDPLFVAGFGNTTCSEIYTAGYVNNSIPQDSCPSLRQSIGDACCTDEYSYFWYVHSSLRALALTPSASSPNESVFGNESSDICGPSSLITSDKYDLPVYTPGLGNVTCGDVKNASAYYGSGFDFETCPAAAASVNGTCCTTVYFWYVRCS
jgi:hypothetical protein